MDGQLVAFTGVAAGMIAMPGADFTVVVRNALDSRRAGVAAALGVAGGLLIHTALAVAGLAALLVAVPALFTTVQLLGGCYLLYLGVRSLSALRVRATASAADAAPDVATPDVTAPSHTAATSGLLADRRTAALSLRQGFLTNALNPKAPVLFLSLLPQFVPQGEPAVPRTLLLAALVVVMALIWFPAVALLVDRLGGYLRRPRVSRALETTTGLLLTFLGLTLLTESLLPL